MPNLSEYNEYKKLLVRAIINDRDCVNLITNRTDVTLPATDLIETKTKPNQIHLYDYIPGTSSSAQTHVCIDIDDGNTTTPVVGSFYLYVDVIVPESLMVISGNIRRDALAAAIDKILNGRTEYGFGTVKRIGGGRGMPADGFRGRQLRYYVQGWNMAGEQLWPSET